MVNTGYISFITFSGGGFDSKGRPIVETKVSSDYYPCNLATVKREYKVLSEGQYRVASFSVYVDSDSVKEVVLNQINEVELKDADGNELGSFQIINMEYLKLMKRVKIVL